MFKSYLQSESWKKFKEGQGWLGKSFVGHVGLKRNLPFGQSLWYLPELPWEETLKKLPELVSELRQESATFARLEFLIPFEPERASLLIKLGLIKSFEDVQPEYRQWVSLDKSEEKILEQMKPKGRYNIKVAERHNLKVERGTEESLVRRFFPLYEKTAERSDFQGRCLKYFLDLVKIIAEDKVGEVVVVSKDGQDLAAGIFIYYEGLASYLYGGSGGDRALMGPYLMHWEVIKEAKKQKCLIYDLLAVAPPETENHPYAGLTRFKTQFGGETIRMLGSWDLINRPLWYKMYRFIERRRRKVTS